MRFRICSTQTLSEEYSVEDIFCFGKINKNTKAIACLKNFGEISYLLKTHLNICCVSEECSVEVAATYFASD